MWGKEYFLDNKKQLNIIIIVFLLLSAIFGIAMYSMNKNNSQQTNPACDEASEGLNSTEEIVISLTNTQALQKIINETKEFSKITVEGICKGNPGDIIFIDKSIALYGFNASLENITLKVNTDKQIWIDGLAFEGNKTTNNAIIIKNAGTDSAVVRCTFNNYKEDAVVIDKIVDGTMFMFAENNFVDFGLAETKIDAAITLNATEKSNATYEIFDNTFFLTKEMDDMDESNMDVAFQTVTVDNAEEVYSDTFVKFIGNEIQKGSFAASVDVCTDIADENFNFENFD